MEKENKMLKTSKINKKEKQNPTVTKVKRESGITLIALVITIVVLIILATVSITLTLREGSIFSGAETAKQMQEMAGIKEEADIVKNELITKSYTEEGVEFNKSTLLQALQQHFTGSWIDGDKVIVRDGKYEIVVDDNLNITVGKIEDSSGGGEGSEGGLKLNLTLEPIDKSSKVIQIAYEEISSIKLEAVILNMLGENIDDNKRKDLQEEATANGTTYEERLLEFAIEKSSNPQMQITEQMRAGMQAEAASFGITYEEYLIENIMGALGETIDSSNRNYAKQEAVKEGITYLRFLVNFMNIDILNPLPNNIEVTLGNTQIGVVKSEAIVTRNGIYKVKATTADGMQAEKEIEVTGIEEEKFSEIYGTTQEYIDGNDQKAVIPAGFAVGTSKNINTIANGLVITDAVDSQGYSIGNEFVWIPVGEEEGDFKRENLTNISDSNWKYYTEPLSYNDATGYEGEAEEYNKMEEQVTGHHGFYISRYEAGIDSTEFRTGETAAQTVVSKRGVAPYNWVRWGETTDNIGERGAVYLSQNMYEGDEIRSNSVTSTLIYGVQWDTMCKFIEDYTQTTSTKSSVDVTGRTVGDNQRNIYDLAGNCREWTMEAHKHQRSSSTRRQLL